MIISHRPEERAGYVVRFHEAMSKTQRLVLSWITSSLEDGLTVQQYFILKQIAEEERMSSSLLAEQMNVKPSAITAMIDRLVKNGFIERLDDPSDRRVTFLKLTEKGVETLEKAHKLFLDVAKRLLGVLDEAEVEPFILVFERIAEEASKLRS